MDTKRPAHIYTDVTLSHRMARPGRDFLNEETKYFSQTPLIEYKMKRQME
jgi:hypothetical protein